MTCMKHISAACWLKIYFSIWIDISASGAAACKPFLLEFGCDVAFYPLYINTGLAGFHRKLGQIHTKFSPSPPPTGNIPMEIRGKLRLVLHVHQVNGEPVN
jgi:hypothetical protein